jgi:ribosomal protein L29
MLELDQIRIDGGTQSRVELNQETVAEYAQAFMAGAAFPPVVVVFDGASYWLADGFHRYFGARDAGESAIAVQVINGTQRDAVLYSLKANATHGLRRTNADKRKAVETLLKDAEWAKWSNREIARAADVSESLVRHLRENADATATRTVERNGKTYTQNTANIGKKQAVESDSTPAVATAKPAHKAAPEAPPAPTNHELEEAVSTINELAAENDQLRDRVAVAAMQGTDEERAMAAETIAELREQIKTLEAELDAVRTSRDTFQRQNAELMKQVRLQQKQIKKLGG